MLEKRKKNRRFVAENNQASLNVKHIYVLPDFVYLKRLFFGPVHHVANYPSAQERLRRRGQEDQETRCQEDRARSGTWTTSAPSALTSSRRRTSRGDKIRYDKTIRHGKRENFTLKTVL